MVRSMHELENYTIGATDGEIGHIKDFFFDDQAWVVRYLVVETGSWLLSRKVLISPFAVGEPDWAHKRLPVGISKEQVKNSPDIDTEKPVSRQHEMHYMDYYGYPYYWGGTGLWGDGLYYPFMASTGYSDADIPYAREHKTGTSTENPHLRSAKEVIGYHIHASDGDIGHVEGLLVDEDTWAIRYMVVNTSNWWLGHPVLIAPEWITKVSWEDASVTVNLQQLAVKNCPRFDTTEKLNREQEVDFYRYYNRTGYWVNETSKTPLPQDTE